MTLVSLADIRAAAQRLRGITVRTPLLAAGSAFVKPESLQPTGSFKLRGAYNALAQLEPASLRRGVVTHSSGNHGQALAYAARLVGTRALVVMPHDAPHIKVERVRALGAEIEFVGSSHEERAQRAHQLAYEQGLELIPSANDPRVISGQGTIGLELVEQLLEIGSQPPAELTVFVPIGQGGLAAGVGTAVKSLVPAARLIGVEPALAADARESLATGRIVRWPTEQVQRTLADGLRMESLAPLPFAHLQRYVDDVVTVEEEQIEAALVRAAGDLRLVLEPSGAVSLAAMWRAAAPAGGTCVAVLSGGNIHGRLYATAPLSSSLMEQAATPHVTLLEAARTVARGGELDAKLDALAEQARSTAGASAALIYLLDPVASVLLPAAQAGLDESVLDAQHALPVDDPDELAARAVRERRTLRSADTSGGSRLLSDSGQAAKSLVAVPMVAVDAAGGDEAQGVLLAALGDGPADQTIVDHTLGALADLSALAIRNARLENALLERADWMERMASTDTLTGLANRTTFLRMLELEIARATRQGTPLSLVVFDVDDFAALNERAGGDAGDDVLRLVASALADQVRLVDTIGRLGPDEFGLIAPGGGGAVVARRVQQAANAIEAGGRSTSLGVGAVLLPERAGTTAEEFLASASAALAEAQQRGPGELAGDAEP